MQIFLVLAVVVLSLANIIYREDNTSFGVNLIEDSVEISPQEWQFLNEWEDNEVGYFEEEPIIPYKKTRGLKRGGGRSSGGSIFSRSSSRTSYGNCYGDRCSTTGGDSTGIIILISVGGVCGGVCLYVCCKAWCERRQEREKEKRKAERKAKKKQQQ